MDKEEIKTGRGGRRAGAGRPFVGDDAKLKTRGVRLTDAEWNHCEREWMQGITASAYVRGLIQADMKRRAGNGPEV